MRGEEADFSGLKRVGMDKTTRYKEHNYIILFYDLDEKRHFFGPEDQKQAVESGFSADLRVNGGDPDQIKQTCSDM